MLLSRGGIGVGYQLLLFSGVPINSISIYSGSRYNSDFRKSPVVVLVISSHPFLKTLSFQNLLKYLKRASCQVFKDSNIKYEAMEIHGFGEILSVFPAS
jgi:hypothetical protein